MTHQEKQIECENCGLLKSTIDSDPTLNCIESHKHTFSNQEKGFCRKHNLYHGLKYASCRIADTSREMELGGNLVGNGKTGYSLPPQDWKEEEREAWHETDISKMYAPFEDAVASYWLSRMALREQKVYERGQDSVKNASDSEFLKVRTEVAFNQSRASRDAEIRKMIEEIKFLYSDEEKRVLSALLSKMSNKEQNNG